MADPVMVATGHTYDRVCIERWLAQVRQSGAVACSASDRAPPDTWPWHGLCRER